MKNTVFALFVSSTVCVHVQHSQVSCKAVQVQTWKYCISQARQFLFCGTDHVQLLGMLEVTVAAEKESG